MTTVYAIHEHTSPSPFAGEPPMTDLILEFVPSKGKPSYWAMPECVGSFKPTCTYCGTEELGELTQVGSFDTVDQARGLIKMLMGGRFGYNDRLRTNANLATRAAMGESVV